MSTQGTYEDDVDVIGEVLAADVVRGTAWVRVNSSLKVRLSFLPEQERIVTEALQAHRSCRLRIKGRGEYSPTGRLRRVTEAEELSLGDVRDAPPDGPHRPIEEVIHELAAGVPQDEWDKLPADLSDQIDHYVYGTPKR